MGKDFTKAWDDFETCLKKFMDDDYAESRYGLRASVRGIAEKKVATLREFIRLDAKGTAAISGKPRISKESLEDLLDAVESASIRHLFSEEAKPALEEALGLK